MPTSSSWPCPRGTTPSSASAAMASPAASGSGSPSPARCSAIPSILILDEATSAVDIQDEALIRKAIEEFSRGPHHVPDLAQPRHDPVCGPDHPDRRRQDRRHRHRPGAARNFAALPPAPRDPLPPRDRVIAHGRQARSPSPPRFTRSRLLSEPARTLAVDSMTDRIETLDVDDLRLRTRWPAGRSRMVRTLTIGVQFGLHCEAVSHPASRSYELGEESSRHVIGLRSEFAHGGSSRRADRTPGSVGRPRSGMLVDG